MIAPKHRARSFTRLFLALLFIPVGVPAQHWEQESSEDLLLTKGRFADPFVSRYYAPFLNFGWTDYENYREGIPIFKRYDAFGNYLTEGYEVFRMEETRAVAQGEQGSVLLKGQFYENWLRHLIIVDDAYGGWSTRLMVGDAISTTFSPLTLNMARLNGIRWDEASANNRFSIILSRISDPIKLDLKDRLDRGGERRTVTDGVYLMGGHWESHVGDFLILGGTYVNLHRFDSSRGFTTNTRKGLAPPQTSVQEVIVRFQDDSPEDGVGGAAVFAVSATAHIREGGVDRFEKIPASAPEVSEGVAAGPRHVEASGYFENRQGFRIPVFVEYSFPVPDSTVGVKIAAVVGNDYQILTRQDHRYTVSSGGGARTTEFVIARRAEGNVIDMSNKGQVVFEQGMLTGQDVVGLNGSASVSGFEVRGEVARSSTYFQHAADDGERADYDDFGWYVTVEKEIHAVSLGFEGFHIGPKYNTYAFKSAARQKAEANPEFSSDGVQVPFINRTFGVLQNEDIVDSRTAGTHYFFNLDDRQDPASTYRNSGGNKLNNPIYALVDDNDDIDQWPDDWVQDWDIAGRESKYLESDAGVYPFFDFDADGFADNNRNRNELLDSDEPFLMYFTDPREFYFGDDFNNNFLLDMWEDDDQPNYPYFKDEEGFHVTAASSLAPGLEATLGRYSVDQIAGGGHNDVTYGRLRYEWSQGDHWRLRLDHESKTVEDDIANPYFDFRVDLISDGRLVPMQFFFPDLLEARDSFVNRGLLHVEYKPGRYWNINAKLRYELNDQQATTLDNGDVQPEDDVDFVGYLIKGDYTRHYGRMAFMPRFKLQYRRQERSTIALPLREDLILAPLVRIDYHLTHRSTIAIGAQGLPLLVDRRIDFRDRDNDAKHQTYQLAWINQSNFGGYKIGTEAGAEYRSINFDVSGLPDESFVRFFFKMFAGVGTVQ